MDGAKIRTDNRRNLVLRSSRYGIIPCHDQSSDSLIRISPHLSSILKSPDAIPSRIKCRRANTISYPSAEPSPTAPLSKHTPTMPDFVPRSFPPPPLAHVPLEYIIDQLHYLAPHYWNRPETSDCTILVPIPNPRGKSMRSSDARNFPPPSVAGHGPAGLGRRVSEPTVHNSPRISLNLHIDYLAAQSTFLRGLFSGSSPLDLINTSSNSPTKSNTQNRMAPTRFTVPPDRLPRLLPSSPNHPILLLPVPDPSSFQLLVHWIYFGRTDFIEDCLNRGVIQWEGIARNVEYLGFPTSLKIFLGRWYGDWLRSKQVHQPRSSVPPLRNKSLSSSRPMSPMDVDSDSGVRGRKLVARPMA